MMKMITKPIESKIMDRRRSPRRAISETVKLELEDGMSADHLALLVTGISDGGVRLFAKDVIFPATFSLVFPESGLCRKCRIVWRVGSEVGVEFVARPDSRHKPKGRMTARREKVPPAKTPKQNGN
jgi:PilZ domain